MLRTVRALVWPSVNVIMKSFSFCNQVTVSQTNLDGMNAHEQRWQIEINENISNVDFLDQLLKITFLLNSMAFLLSWSFQLHFSFSVFFF